VSISAGSRVRPTTSAPHRTVQRGPGFGTVSGWSSRDIWMLPGTQLPSKPCCCWAASTAGVFAARCLGVAGQVAIKLGSQVWPPSTENDCSTWCESASISTRPCVPTPIDPGRAPGCRTHRAHRGELADARLVHVRPSLLEKTCPTGVPAGCTGQGHAFEVAGRAVRFDLLDLGFTTPDLVHHHRAVHSASRWSRSADAQTADVSVQRRS